MDVDGAADTNSPLPLNLMCLCFSLVVFGAVGSLLSGLMTKVWITIVCLAALAGISAGAYFLLYRFVVQPLKKSNPRAIKQWDLFAETGRLTLRITENSPGVVSLKDSTGAAISYRASAKKEVLANWDGEIPQGAEVLVVDIDSESKMAYVKPLDTFQNLKLKKSKEI